MLKVRTIEHEEGDEVELTLTMVDTIKLTGVAAYPTGAAHKIAVQLMGLLFTKYIGDYWTLRSWIDHSDPDRILPILRETMSLGFSIEMSVYDPKTKEYLQEERYLEGDTLALRKRLGCRNTFHSIHFRKETDNDYILWGIDVSNAGIQPMYVYYADKVGGLGLDAKDDDPNRIAERIRTDICDYLLDRQPTLVC